MSEILTNRPLEYLELAGRHLLELALLPPPLPRLTLTIIAGGVRPLADRTPSRATLTAIKGEKPWRF